VGMSTTGLGMMAKDSGLTAEQCKAFLATLEPVFVHHTLPLQPPIILEGQGPEVGWMAAVWSGLGHPVHAEAIAEEKHLGEVFASAHYVLAPTELHRWLRRDRVHTPIIFSDQSITIGPRVVPGDTACLHCVHQAAVAKNPHLIALSSQLWGKRAPSATPELATLAAWEAHQLMVRARVGEITRIDVFTRTTSTSWAVPSTHCSCRDLVGS